MELSLFKIINKKPFYKNKELNVCCNTQGYSYVNINNKRYRLHRLIAMKYISNPDNKPVVDHIDNNKENNSISNLQWLTYSENSKKAYIDNDNMKFKGSLKRNILTIDQDGNTKKHKSIREVAKYLNRNVAGVYRCLKGEWTNCNKHKVVYEY